MGVVDSEGQYRLVDSGPLPEAVAASAAIPYIFAPVNVPGQAAILPIPSLHIVLSASLFSLHEL